MKRLIFIFILFLYSFGYSQEIVLKDAFVMKSNYRLKKMDDCFKNLIAYFEQNFIKSPDNKNLTLVKINDSLFMGKIMYNHPVYCAPMYYIYNNSVEEFHILTIPDCFIDEGYDIKYLSEIDIYDKKGENIFWILNTSLDFRTYEIYAYKRNEKKCYKYNHWFNANMMSFYPDSTFNDLIIQNPIANQTITEYFDNISRMREKVLSKERKCVDCSELLQSIEEWQKPLLEERKK